MPPQDGGWQIDRAQLLTSIIAGITTALILKYIR